MSAAVTERVFRLLQITRINLHGPVQLPHKLRVTRVYKAILKNQLDWAIFRDVWAHDAAKTQKIFRARAGEMDRARAEAFVQEAEDYLRSRRHPDPVTPIYVPGGTLYQRNSPLPDYVRTSHTSKPRIFPIPPIPPPFRFFFLILKRDHVMGRRSIERLFFARHVADRFLCALLCGLFCDHVVVEG
jgi:NADH dehydrogenase (ubiquinone) 1 beta subcomplex subunit 9